MAHTKPLQRGIFFDPSHRRRPYRVRIYLNRDVIHLSYHATRTEAELALREARAMQFTGRPKGPVLHALRDQLEALRMRQL